MNALPGLKRRIQLVSQEDGVLSVELVILFPVIALIILAILEFGHLWLVRHTLTIASREGARAAVVFVPGTDAERVTAAKNTATNTVNSYLQNTAKWNSGDWTVPEPTVSGSGPLTGQTLTVQVQATNALLVLHKLFRPISIAAETTMRFE